VLVSSDNPPDLTIAGISSFADGSYVKQMVIGTLLGSCRRW
jgi:hypothetical protein